MVLSRASTGPSTPCFKSQEEQFEPRLPRWGQWPDPGFKSQKKRFEREHPASLAPFAGAEKLLTYPGHGLIG